MEQGFFNTLLSHCAARILEAEQMLGGEGNICHVLDMLSLLALEKRRRIPPSLLSLHPGGLQMEQQKETTQVLPEQSGL